MTASGWLSRAIPRRRTTRWLSSGLASGEEIATFSGHAGIVTALAFSPDGRRLATGGNDKAVKIWDLDARREEFAFRGHAGGIADVTFSPDGTRVLRATSSRNWHHSNLGRSAPFEVIAQPVRVDRPHDGR